VKHGPHLLGYTPAGLNTSGFGTGINLFDQVLGVAGNMAADTARNLAGRGARAVVNRAEEAVERFKTRTSGLGGPGGTGGVGVRAQGFGANGETSLLSMNTEPMKVEFLTGVDTTMYPPNINAPSITVGDWGTNDEREVTSDLSCIRLRIPPTNQYCSTYWNQVYLPNIQIRAQASVGFNINAGVNFSYANVTAYFNLLLYALSKYFFMANTYSVIQGPGQRDLSREKLRLMFQTADLQYLRLLKERLDALPIPPALIAEASFMYSMYKTNVDSDCSNTIGFTPVPLVALDQNEPVFNIVNMGILGTISELSKLDDPASSVRDTVAMMARVFPSWVDTTVYPTQTFPEYSEKFTARFINSPAFQTTFIGDGNAYTYHLPFVSGVNDKTKFCISQKFDKTEIGDIQASCSIWDGSSLATDKWTGTMVPDASTYNYGNPSTIRNTSRYSFVYINGATDWVPSNYSTAAGVSSISTLPMRQPYVNFLAGMNDHYATPFGTYDLYGNSVNAMSQPTIDWLGKMFDFDSYLSKNTKSDRSYGKKKRTFGKRKNKSGKMEVESEKDK